MVDTVAARTRLHDALTELEARLSRVVRDLDEPPNPDWDEQAVAMEDDEALEHQAELIEGEIASVRRALARITNGTYGECARCGGEIARARLEARPEAALCIDCARLAG